MNPNEVTPPASGHWDPQDESGPLGTVGDFTPPLGGHAPALQCNRLLAGTFEEPAYCGRPGIWHIMWTADLENGIACDEHAQEARERWAFFAIHEYEPACSMSHFGAVYVHAINRCVIPGDPALEAAAEQEVKVDVDV